MEQKWEGDWDADHRHRLKVDGRTVKGSEWRDNLATKLKVRSGMAEIQGC